MAGTSGWDGARARGRGHERLWPLRLPADRSLSGLRLVSVARRHADRVCQPYTTRAHARNGGRHEPRRGGGPPTLVANGRVDRLRQPRHPDADSPGRNGPPSAAVSRGSGLAWRRLVPGRPVARLLGVRSVGALRRDAPRASVDGLAASSRLRTWAGRADVATLTDGDLGDPSLQFHDQRRGNERNNPFQHLAIHLKAWAISRFRISGVDNGSGGVTLGAARVPPRSWATCLGTGIPYAGSLLATNHRGGLLVTLHVSRRRRCR